MVEKPLPLPSIESQSEFRRKIRLKPVYLLIIETMVYSLTMDEIDNLGKDIDKIAKQRDDIVTQMYKTMLFLASLLLLVFLIEIGVIRIPSSALGVEVIGLKNQAPFIFGFLLVGNIIALLFSSAMVKMFMLESVLANYCRFRADGAGIFIAGLTYRFYAYIFALIAEQHADRVPPAIAQISRAIHRITVVVLPLAYLCAYGAVLILALLKLHAEPQTGLTLVGVAIETWYLLTLVFFNVVTLSFYLFAFFPCRSPEISAEELHQLTLERAQELWERGGRPEGKDEEIRRLAERQVRLRYYCTQTGARLRAPAV